MPYTEYSYPQYMEMGRKLRSLFEREDASLEELVRASRDGYLLARRFCQSVAKEDFMAAHAAKWSKLSLDRSILKRFAQDLETDWEDAVASYGDVPRGHGRCNSCQRILKPVFDHGIGRATGNLHQCACKKW